MKKLIFNILLSASAVLGTSVTLTSCQDELDVTPDGRTTMEEVFSSADNTKDYFASAWAHIPRKMFFYYFFENYMIDMADEGWSSDDGQPLLIDKIYAGSFNTIKHHFEWDDPTMDKWDGGYWVRYWQMVRILNNCIINFPTAAFDSEADRDRCLAEARVLRAYYYLLLTKFYGDLPIITDAMSINSPYASLERQPAYEVFQHIVAECKDVVENSQELPWRITSVKERNRMTKGIACAIISQASLYAASPLYCHGENLWKYAADMNKYAFDKLIENGYELYNHINNTTAYKTAYEEYFASFSYAGSKADDLETIWGASQCGGAGVNTSAINGVPLLTGQFKAGVCPTQELVDAYDMLATGEPIYDLNNPYVDEKHSDININPKSGYDPKNPYNGRDPRFAACIIYNGSKVHDGVFNKTIETWNNEKTWDGDKCNYATTGAGNCKIDFDLIVRKNCRTGYYNRKYHVYKLQPNDTKDDGNWKFFRLGEVYLNYAEAAAESGDITTAMKLVNDIRHRAKFDPKVDKVASGIEEARLIVRHERHVELAFEEHRYFDVRRWATPDQEITEEKYNTGMWIHKDGTKYVYNRFPLGFSKGTAPSKNHYDGKYRLVPIPLSDSNILGAATGKGADYWQNPGWE